MDVAYNLPKSWIFDRLVAFFEYLESSIYTVFGKKSRGGKENEEKNVKEKLYIFLLLFGWKR